MYENQLKSDFIEDVIIDESEETIKLIGQSKKNIQIWNFNTGEKIINLEFHEDLGKIYSINAWNSPLYFISTSKNGKDASTNLKIVDIRNGKIIQNLDYKKDILTFIRKINHHSIGDVLIARTKAYKIELLLPDDK